MGFRFFVSQEKRVRKICLKKRLNKHKTTDLKSEHVDSPTKNR